MLHRVLRSNAFKVTAGALTAGLASSPAPAYTAAGSTASRLNQLEARLGTLEKEVTALSDAPAAAGTHTPGGRGAVTRLIRFVAPDGQTYQGEEPAHGVSQYGQPTYRAEVVTGSVFDGSLRRTGETKTVAKLLSPVAPNTIYCIGLNYMKVPPLLLFYYCSYYCSYVL
jgi:hypothetical protein